VALGDEYLLEIGKIKFVFFRRWRRMWWKRD
jgi:hypothetical protein